MNLKKLSIYQHYKINHSLKINIIIDENQILVEKASF